MNTPLRLLAVTLFALFALLGSRHAQATTTCTASMTNLAFGPVDPTGALVDATATLTYSCTFSGLLSGLLGDYITLCFNIGTGTGGSSAAPRTMRDAASDTMNFQMYTDAAHSLVWGSSSVPGTSTLQTTLHFQILSSGTSRGGSLTLFGRVPSGQTSLHIGGYGSNFTGGDAQMNYAYNEAVLDIGNFPATCTGGGSGSGTGTYPFSSSASVASRCQLATASDMNFGSPASNFAGNIDQVSGISMTCTNGTAWQIGLDNGQSALATTRRMIGGSSYVVYELYRDTGRTLRWGNTLNSDTLSGSGSGNTQTLSVYGRVAPQAGAAAGSYSDKITVTITY
ncbi:MAG TPA: spore coat U domain-containing protein [Dokdonella sp.]